VPGRRQRTSEVGLLWFRLFEHGGRRRARRVSIRGLRRKPGDVRAPGGALADESRKGCAKERLAKAGEANSDAHLSRIPSRANGLDRAGSHTERRWRHAVSHDRRVRGRIRRVSARGDAYEEAHGTVTSRRGKSGA